MSVAATNALGAIDSNRARRRPCDGGGRPAAAARDRRRRRARARAARAPAGNPATKLILRHAEHETVAIQDLARELVGERATVVASGSEAVEVTAAGVNKATAVAELGVPPEQVVAFGDFPNDIPLLTWTGHGVAMGNAHPDVVAIADEVTATNDEDGVALVLERLVRA